MNDADRKMLELSARAAGYEIVMKLNGVKSTPPPWRRLLHEPGCP